MIPDRMRDAGREPRSFRCRSAGCQHGREVRGVPQGRALPLALTPTAGGTRTRDPWVGAADGRRRAAGATRRCRGRLLEPPPEPQPAGATRGATRRCSPGSRSGGAAHRRALQREQPPPPTTHRPETAASRTASLRAGEAGATRSTKPGGVAGICWSTVALSFTCSPLKWWTSSVTNPTYPSLSAGSRTPPRRAPVFGHQQLEQRVRRCGLVDADHCGLPSADNAGSVLAHSAAGAGVLCAPDPAARIGCGR